MHLTNYAINKDSKKYKMANDSGADEERGHKRSLKSILEWLRTKHNCDTDKLMQEIKEIVVKTMLSIQPDLLHNYRTC